MNAATMRVARTAQVALGAVLLWAGIAKVGATWSLAEAIANFRMVPAWAAQVLAVTLPWCEILTALLLIFGLWGRAAALLGAGLFGSFVIAAASALARGLDIDCGCFGTGSAMRLGIQTLVMDLAGFGIAAGLVWKASSSESPTVDR